MKKTVIRIIALVALLFSVQPNTHAQQKPLEKVRLTVPAKALTFVPYYFGKAEGIFAKEGIDLDIIVMRPPLGVTALVAGGFAYSWGGGVFFFVGVESVYCWTTCVLYTMFWF